VAHSIQKILAGAIPVYLMLQFLGCLYVCAFELEHTDNEPAKSTEFLCPKANAVPCGINSLPKLTVADRQAVKLESVAATVITPFNLRVTDEDFAPDLSLKRTNPPTTHLARPPVLRI
jgi:hypothetical protein